MRKISIVFLLILTVFLLTTAVSAKNSLQTQSSTDGKIEASLTEAKVRRGVLTVKISLKNISKDWLEPQIPYEAAYYTDSNENKKYYALKDSEGKYIAGPATVDWGGGTFKEKMPPDETKLLWIKFPAPPETTGEIDIFIPGVLPFEEIEIKR